MPTKMTKEEALAEMRMLEEFGFNTMIYRNHKGEICSKKSRARYSPSRFENPELLSDRDFMSEAVRINGNILEIAAEPLRYDKELLLAAASNSDWLQWGIELPEELLSDEAFMVRLLSVNGEFIRQVDFKDFAPFTEREKKLIAAAVSCDYRTCGYVKTRLRFELIPENRGFAFELLAINGMTLLYMGKKLRDDEEIVLKAAENTYRSFEFASYRLRNDADFVLRILEVNPSCLAYAPKSMREDRELVTRLMQKNAFVYRYALGEMKSDASLALQAVKAAPKLYDYLNVGMKCENVRFLEGIDEFVEDELAPQEIREKLKACLQSNDGYRRWKANR
ncbi:MAG: DUF4116 domain-containing protein [Candidatus Coproplasma sp.]